MARLAKCPVETEALEFGDYVFGGSDSHTIALERKTISDLEQSMKGRLDDQMRGCLETYDEVGLLVELNGELDSSWFVGVLRSFQRNGIDVYMCEKGETPKAVTAIYNHANKNGHKFMNRYIRKKPSIWRADPMVETVLSIAYCNNVRLELESAKELVRRYGNLLDMVDSAEEWVDIKGIGKGTRDNLLNVNPLKHKVRGLGIIYLKL